jgi:hypothetical protein
MNIFIRVREFGIIVRWRMNRSRWIYRKLNGAACEVSGLAFEGTKPFGTGSRGWRQSLQSCWSTCRKGKALPLIIAAKPLN